MFKKKYTDKHLAIAEVAGYEKGLHEGAAIGKRVTQESYKQQEDFAKLRDTLASQALCGLVAKSTSAAKKELSMLCYEYADAMLAARVESLQGVK